MPPRGGGTNRAEDRSAGDNLRCAVCATFSPHRAYLGRYRVEEIALRAITAFIAGDFAGNCEDCHVTVGLTPGRRADQPAAGPILRVTHPVNPISSSTTPQPADAKNRFRPRVPAHTAASASTTSSFRGSIRYPMPSLCRLRTLRCRDARNTRYRAARYALPGRDLHPLDYASFPGAPCADPNEPHVKPRVRSRLV